mmetsp:Transcript_49588/g.138781  ORF Transcript_49588/g.138781 Transcript_49588/m.138781 type:complete len:249 (-) Transcript_49588:575-1321(-)
MPLAGSVADLVPARLSKYVSISPLPFTSVFRASPSKRLSCLTYAHVLLDTCTQFFTPVLCILEAVLTVSPKSANCGFRDPTTPLRTRPECTPIRTETFVIFWTPKTRRETCDKNPKAVSTAFSASDAWRCSEFMVLGSSGMAAAMYVLPTVSIFTVLWRSQTRSKYIHTRSRSCTKDMGSSVSTRVSKSYMSQKTIVTMPRSSRNGVRLAFGADVVICKSLCICDTTCWMTSSGNIPRRISIVWYRDF